MPVFIIAGAEPVAGYHCFIARDRDRGATVCIACTDLDELAEVVYWHLAQFVEGVDPAASAWSPNGRPLEMAMLRERRARVFRARLRRAWVPCDFRRGPVHGVRKTRGGPGYMRRPASIGEKRQAAALKEEGEIAPRAARSVRNLIDARDDHMRHVERCWKAQRRGCKAWDR